MKAIRVARVGAMTPTKFARITGVARAAVVWLWLAGLASAQGLPTTGSVVPGLESLDSVVPAILERHGVPGASLAIVRGGKLKVARGYGYADLATQAPVRPESPFLLASVSKSITAVTVLELVEQGRLRLDDHPFRMLDVRPLPGATEDPRLRDITVRELLNHSGGWNRKTSGDPNGWSRRIARAMDLRLPISVHDLIRYMLGVPLDFTPGTDAVYSNFGYVVLGATIAKVTGLEYREAVRQITLGPMGLDRVRLHDGPRGELPDEVHRYVAGTETPLPDVHLPMMVAAGGWTASAVDMAWFLAQVDGSRTGTTFLSADMMQQMLAAPPPTVPVRPNGTWFGLGWDVVRPTPRGPLYQKDGGLPGISTFIQHMPDGTDWVLFLNATPPRGDRGEPSALRAAMRRIPAAIRAVPSWPDGDLFEQFRR